MRSGPWRVLALAPAPPEVLRGFLGDGDWELLQPDERTQAAVCAAAGGIDMVLGDWTHTLRVDREVLDAAPGLALVQQPAAGTDTIDLKVAAERGIPVCNTGSANTVAVAEWCLLAAMAVQRQLLAADAAVRAGRWPQLELSLRELAGARVGLLGMGRIGQAAAYRFAAMGAEVSYWSRSVRPELDYRWAPLGEVLDASDVLVCALPSTPETRGLLDAAALARLPQDGVLVNAGRGDLLDEAALCDALHAGRLAGAALDVYEREPLPPESPLREAPRLLLSPHCAGATAQARLALVRAVQDNLRRATTGQPVAEVVNGVDPFVRRR